MKRHGWSASPHCKTSSMWLQLWKCPRILPASVSVYRKTTAKRTIVSRYMSLRRTQVVKPSRKALLPRNADLWPSPRVFVDSRLYTKYHARSLHRLTRTSCYQILELARGKIKQSADRIESSIMDDKCTAWERVWDYISQTFGSESITYKIEPILFYRRDECTRALRWGYVLFFHDLSNSFDSFSSPRHSCPVSALYEHLCFVIFLPKGVLIVSKESQKKLSPCTRSACCFPSW